MELAEHYTMTAFELESFRRDEIERFHTLALEEEAKRREDQRRWEEYRTHCPECGRPYDDD